MEYNTHDMSELIVKMRVKPLLLKFVHFYEQVPLEQAVSFAPGSTIGQYLNTVLVGKKNYHRYTWARNASEGAAAELRIRLNLTAVGSQEIFLTPAAQDWFADQLYNFHRDMMIRHVMTARALQVAERTALLQWMQMLNLSEGEDVTIDALTKMSQRKRKETGTVFTRGMLAGAGQFPKKPV